MSARSQSAFVLFPLLCSIASAQATQVKTPRPVPPGSDVKTVAPPVVKGPAVRGATRKPAAPAVQGARTKLPPGLSRPPRVEPDTVQIAEPGDGRLWAHGTGWKASFGPEGAVYIPFFGSCAATNHPMAFSLEGISVGGQPVGFDPNAAASFSGQRISYDRGGVVEVYDLSRRSVEQSLVFQSLPSGGDLSLRMRVSTDLAATSSSEGVRFSNELGTVVYGRATVRDAAGRSIGVDTLVDGAELVVGVPASFLDSAAFPVAIDPVISTFPVDTTSPSDYLPDTAFDVGFHRYLVVEEETFSSSDHDVYATLLDASGGYVNAGYIDQTSDYWSAPSVANNLIADQYLVVGTVSPSGGGGSIIRGVTVSAGGFGMSSQFTISGSESGSKFGGVVGGDPNPFGPTYYCVVWMRVFSSSDEDIVYQLVDSSRNLVLSGSQFIDNSGSTIDYAPSVSKCDGQDPFATQEWNVVWTRQYSTTDHDIYGAQVHWDGSITTPSFPLDVSTLDDYGAVASSPHDAAAGTRDWVVAYQEIVGSDWDVLGYVMNGSSILGSANISGLESAAGSGTWLEQQVNPKIDSDGSKFAITYSESYQGSGFDYDMYIVSLSVVGTNFLLAEGHQNLDFTGDGQYDSGVTSTHSGGGNPGRFMATWDSFNGSNSGDVYGGLYEAPLIQAFCFPGYDALPCPCGNPPSSFGRGCNNSSNTGGASLYATGAPVNDTVVMHASGMRPTASGFCIFFQGSNLAQNGIIFGDGRRCAAIPIKRLYITHAPGGAADAPSGSDPSIKNRSAALGDPISTGMTRWYQVQYRDPLAYACGGTATFNSTNALQIDW
jgi:hypothetical protein